ncbi:MAG: lytic transglycosylase domain-containing protein [Acidobacteriota bacterium]
MRVVPHARLLGVVVAVLFLWPGPGRAGGVRAVSGRDGSLVLTNLSSPAPRGSRSGSSPAPASGSQNGSQPARQRPYSQLVKQISRRYGIDQELIHAVISVESSYDSHAVSPKGARGLMQLLPTTAAAVGVHDLGDPHDNIMAGVRHLRGLLDHYHGNVRLALAAYNAGVSAVDRYGGVPPFPETLDYLRRVQRLYSRSELRGGTSAPITHYVNAQGVLVITQFPPARSRTNRARPPRR